MYHARQNGLASSVDKSLVRLVPIPDNTPMEERVTFQDVEFKPAEPENKVAKKKIFEKLAPDLKTDKEGLEANLTTGTITAPLTDAQVS